MKREIQRLKDEKFDILIIGGGVSGGAIAWDAALRGYKVALIEKKDFGHGTSATTSKLIHGGLRYLAQFDISVVRESLRERRFLEANAPHQAFPLPFLLPIYNFTPTPKWMLGIGLRMYDFLSYDKNDLKDPDKHLSNHRWFNKEETLKLEPGLDPQGLKGSFHYYDVLNKHPHRSNLDYVDSAYSRGAVVANYVEASEFLIKEENGKKTVHGIKAKDLETGNYLDIQAKVTVNATGPWGDLLLSKIHKNPVRKIVRSKGIHLLFKRFHKDQALTFETRDKHHFFIIPWLDYSLIGTTDTPFNGSPDDVRVTKSEALEFMKMINEHYPVNLTLDKLVHTYAGIRPLVAETDVETDATYKASRKHEIINHRKVENIDGLVSVFGGKWTTSRALAEETIDMIQTAFDLPGIASETETTQLVAGSVGDRIALYIAEACKNYGNRHSETLIKHLIEYYGTYYENILEYIEKDPRLGKPFDNTSHHIKAEIHHAVEHDMALSVSDFLMRRSGIGNKGIPADRVLNEITDTMAQLLNWDDARKKQEVQEYRYSQSLVDE